MRHFFSILFGAWLVCLSAPEMAAQDLERIRADAASGNIELERSALVQIRNLRTTDASRLALPLLNDRNELVRASAAGAAIYLPPQEAAAVLIPLLSDKADFVRQETAYALGDVGDPSAVNALISTVQKGPDSVRNAAVIALGKIGDPSAMETLLGVFKKKPNEDGEFLRRSAARSIGQIAQFQVTGRRDLTTPQNYLPTKFKDAGSASTSTERFPGATSVLIHVLQNKKESDDTRREAAFALGWSGSQTAVPVLRQYLTSTDNHLGEIAKEALIRLGAFQ